MGAFRRSLSFLVIAAATQSGLALAAGTQDKGNWTEVDSYMNTHELAALKGEPCKMGSLRVTYAKDTWMKMDSWMNQNPYGLCADVLTAIDSFCRADPANPAKAQKMVKEIHCARGPASACLKGSTLNVTVDGDAEPSDVVKAALANGSACSGGAKAAGRSPQEEDEIAVIAAGGVAYPSERATFAGVAATLSAVCYCTSGLKKHLFESPVLARVGGASPRELAPALAESPSSRGPRGIRTGWSFLKPGTARGRCRRTSRHGARNYPWPSPQSGRRPSSPSRRERLWLWPRRRPPWHCWTRSCLDRYRAGRFSWRSRSSSSRPCLQPRLARGRGRH